MSEQRTEPTFDPDGLPEDVSPEEREAAQLANEAENAQLQAEIQSLQARVAELAAKNTELSEQYLRAQADVQNTRRRADEEVSKARKFAVDSFAESLLPVADSLEAGLAIKDATPEQIREGAEATLRQLKTALERHKVLEIAPPGGTRFDPHQHQAISVVPLPEGSDQGPNTVVTVLQKGYSIAERVLRPALVTVTASQ
ncbi:nucleotide exchange factor GrpE [Ramlibacter sp. AN1015]|uniref:nucleotide exchange factor GrpE n=1 Tax=Ramlibacter sp. AN1015 TaxID=3133428 RepID=UPI0030C0A302